jgi:hypothetical protein
MKRVLTLGLLAGLFVVASGSALAGGGHGHGHAHSRFVLGFNFGVPVYSPWYYYPAPYYYYPPAPAYVQPPAPTQYVERGDVAPEAGPAPATWYFCRESNAYYPYVKQCPGGWQHVPAQPPN